MPSFPVTATPVALVAATVNVDELPDVIVVGFAMMVTVGAEIDVTVTTAVAEIVPPAPVAAAVYVVVAVGLTAWVPPLDCKVYSLPSLPVSLTWVAFAAITVKVDELPAVIEAGLAVMVTVGAASAATVTDAVAEAVPPLPVATAV